MMCNCAGTSAKLLVKVRNKIFMLYKALLNGILITIITDEP